MTGQGTQRPRTRNDRLHPKPRAGNVRPQSPAAISSSSCNFLRDAGPDPRADAERVLYAPRSATRSRTHGAVNVDIVANRGFGPKDPHRHPAHDSTRGRRLSLAQTDRRESPWRSPPGEPAPGSRAVHRTSRCTSACELADLLRVVGSVGWSPVPGIVIGLSACRGTG
jgi:hypothetical protein